MSTVTLDQAQALEAATPLRVKLAAIDARVTGSHHRFGNPRRSEVELYARQLEELGRATATIGRRLSTIAGFYRYATEEGLIPHSPAASVRRPRLDYESHAVGLDGNELGAFLIAAGQSSARDHALASLLGLNGLRVSEAVISATSAPSRSSPPSAVMAGCQRRGGTERQAVRTLSVRSNPIENRTFAARARSRSRA